LDGKAKPCLTIGGKADWLRLGWAAPLVELCRTHTNHRDTENHWGGTEEWHPSRKFRPPCPFSYRAVWSSARSEV